MTNLRATGYLSSLVVGSVLVAAYQTFMYAHGAAPTSPFASAWPIIFLILLVLWVTEDCKSYPAIYKPFEFGFLVFLVWLPYLPYYLWRTRRFRGLTLLVAFIALYLLGFFAMSAVYIAS
jgi:hypothetical protein